MKNTIYVVRNDHRGERKYLAEYKIDKNNFCGTWNEDLDKALEFTSKEEARRLAAWLNNDWNGFGHKALQKCRCKAGR